MISDDALAQRLSAMYPQPSTTGVADLVRERVAAGDVGAPMPPSGGGILSWIPWLAGALVVGLIATGLGASGLLGHPTMTVSDDSAQVTLSQQSSGLDCPGGAPIASLASGTRVLAVERSDDSAWLGVRNPSNVFQVLWVPAGSVVIDEGEAEIATLPSGGCEIAAVEVPEVVPTDVPTDAPTDQPGPATPTDGTAPTITATSVTYSPATGYVCSEPGNSHAIIGITVTDNVAVSGVTSAGGYSGPASGSGTSWSIDYYPTGPSVTAPINFTLTARDAAGNVSAPVVVTVNRDQCPG